MFDQILGETLGQVEVLLGETRVLTVVTGTVVAPRPERPTEGFFQFQTQVNPPLFISSNLNGYLIIIIITVFTNGLC